MERTKLQVCLFFFLMFHCNELLIHGCIGINIAWHKPHMAMFLMIFFYSFFFPELLKTFKFCFNTFYPRPLS